MTAPFELEIEDDRVIAIENSHLSRGRCRCGSDVVFDPQAVKSPRCGPCLVTLAESAVAPVPVPGLQPLGRGLPPAPPAVAERFPVPVVTSRDCWDGCDAPSAVERLAQKARTAGWRIKAQRSEGWTPNAATGRPSAARKTLYALRFAKGGAAAYAVRDGDQWSSVMLWGSETTWFSLANVTELEEYLLADGQVGPEFFARVRKRLADQAAREELRKQCDKGVHSEINRESIGPMNVWWCGLCRKNWRNPDQPWVKPKRGASQAL